MEAPRYWRLKDEKYRLSGSICNKCETPMFPARPICPECGTDCANSKEVQPYSHLLKSDGRNSETQIKLPEVQQKNIPTESATKNIIYQSVPQI